jgi:hypothetical protein
VVFYYLPDICFELGVRPPFVTDAFLDMLSDRAGYLDVFLRMFATLPVYLLTEGLAAVAGWLGGPARGDRVRMQSTLKLKANPTSIVKYIHKGITCAGRAASRRAAVLPGSGF